MAKLQNEFDTGRYEGGDGDFQPLPAGWYRAHAVKSEIRPTKSGDGRYIWFQFEITGPTHEGRVVFAQINVTNPSSQAQEIGRKQLAAFGRAAGVLKFVDTDELHNRSVEIKLAIKRSVEYGDSNEIKGYRPIEGAQQAPRPSQSKS